MERVAPSARHDAYGSRINRSRSETLVYAIPTLTVVLGSIAPNLFIASAIPLVPPLGLLILLAWRIWRPGLFPVWSGFIFGLIDDLLSGQPFGSAIMLWSIAMIAIEIVEARFRWRNFVQDWLMVGTIVAACLFAGAVFSGGQVTVPLLIAILPQLLLSLLLYPIIARMVARLDRLRLMRVWRTG